MGDYNDNADLEGEEGRMCEGWRKEMRDGDVADEVFACTLWVCWSRPGILSGKK